MSSVWLLGIWEFLYLEEFYNYNQTMHAFIVMFCCVCIFWLILRLIRVSIRLRFELHQQHLCNSIYNQNYMLQYNTSIKKKNKKTTTLGTFFNTTEKGKKFKANKI